MDYGHLNPNPKIHKRYVDERIHDIQQNYQAAAVATDHQIIASFLVRFRAAIVIIILLILIPTGMLGITAAVEDQPAPINEEHNFTLSHPIEFAAPTSSRRCVVMPILNLSICS